MQKDKDNKKLESHIFTYKTHRCFYCAGCGKTTGVARSVDFRARGEKAGATLKCNKCLIENDPNFAGRDKSGNQLYKCSNCDGLKVKAQFKKDDFEKDRKVCRACNTTGGKTTSRQPTGAAASPVKTKENEADGPGDG